MVAKRGKRVLLLNFVLSSLYVLQGGIARVERGKNSDFAELTGCEGGGNASSVSLVNWPHMEVDLFSLEEPIPLSSRLIVAKQNCTGSMPDWVLHILKEVCHFVRLFSKGFEEKFWPCLRTLK